MISLVFVSSRISPTPESPEQEPKKIPVSIGGGGFCSPHAGKVPLPDVPTERKTRDIVGLSGEIETVGLYNIVTGMADNLGKG